MTDKIELPGGNWAKLRDPQDITDKQRRPLAKLQRLLAASDLGDALTQRAEMGEEVTEKQLNDLLKPVLAGEEWDLLESTSDLLVVALVEEWSFEQPITAESVQNLPGRVSKALRAACDPLLTDVLGIEGEEAISDPNSNFPETSG